MLGVAHEGPLIIQPRNPFDQISTGLLSDSDATSSSKPSFVPLHKCVNHHRKYELFLEDSPATLTTSSNTATTLTRVNAEHSIYADAPISCAKAWASL